MTSGIPVYRSADYYQLSRSYATVRDSDQVTHYGWLAAAKATTSLERIDAVFHMMDYWAIQQDWDEALYVLERAHQAGYLKGDFATDLCPEDMAFLVSLAEKSPANKLVFHLVQRLVRADYQPAVRYLIHIYDQEGHRGTMTNYCHQAIRLGDSYGAWKLADYYFQFRRQDPICEKFYLQALDLVTPEEPLVCPPPVSFSSVGTLAGGITHVRSTIIVPDRINIRTASEIGLARFYYKPLKEDLFLRYAERHPDHPIIQKLLVAYYVDYPSLTGVRFALEFGYPAVLQAAQDHYEGNDDFPHVLCQWPHVQLPEFCGDVKREYLDRVFGQAKSYFRCIPRDIVGLIYVYLY